MEKTNHENLIVGKKYEVNFDDCCINGGFTAVFLGWKIIEDNQSMWDNGVILGPDGGRWNCYEEEL